MDPISQHNIENLKKWFPCFERLFLEKIYFESEDKSFKVMVCKILKETQRISEQTARTLNLNLQISELKQAEMKVESIETRFLKESSPNNPKTAENQKLGSNIEKNPKQLNVENDRQNKLEEEKVHINEAMKEEYKIAERIKQDNREEILEDLILNLHENLEEEHLNSTIKTFQKLIQNILSNPDSQTYKQIKLSNPTIEKHITSNETACIILDTLDFEPIQLDSENYYILPTPNPAYLQRFLTLLTTTKPKPKPQKLLKSRSTLPHLLQEAQLCRQQRTHSQKTAQMDLFNKLPQEEAKDTKERRQARMMTIEDLRLLHVKEHGDFEKDRLGYRCMILSNEFRMKHKLGKCGWNEGLWEIAMTHSKNMADGVVPFGHEGFDNRKRMIKFHWRKFCENVGYNYNNPDPCEVSAFVCFFLCFFRLL